MQLNLIPQNDLPTHFVRRTEAAHGLAQRLILPTLNHTDRKLINSKHVTVLAAHSEGTARISGQMHNTFTLIALPPHYAESQADFSREYAGVVAHETAHHVRHNAVGPNVTLADAIVDEGLALHMGRSIDPEHAQHFNAANRDASAMRNFTDLSSRQFRDGNFSYNEWFSGRPKGQELQAGYAIGDFIVGTYLQGKNKSAAQALGTPTNEIVHYAIQRIESTIPMSEQQLDRRVKEMLKLKPATPL